MYAPRMEGEEGRTAEVDHTVLTKIGLLAYCEGEIGLVKGKARNPARQHE